MCPSGEPAFVLLGKHNIKENINTNDHSVQLNVAENIPYSKYTAASNYDDIALIRLERPAVFNQFIRPACLPTAAVTGTSKVIASGWGKVEFEGPSSNSLLKVTLELFEHDECNTTFRNHINRRLANGIVDRSQVCAGSHTEEKDTCQVSIIKYRMLLN